MQAVRIPRHADDPPHILLWSMDEIAPMLIGLTFGVLVGQAFVCLLIGIVVSQAYKRFRDNHPDGFIIHAMYWAGIPISQSKHFPNPFKRLYIS